VRAATLNPPRVAASRRRARPASGTGRPGWKGDRQRHRGSGALPPPRPARRVSAERAEPPNAHSHRPLTRTGHGAAIAVGAPAYPARLVGHPIVAAPPARDKSSPSRGNGERSPAVSSASCSDAVQDMWGFGSTTAAPFLSTKYKEQTARTFTAQPASQRYQKHKKKRNAGSRTTRKPCNKDPVQSRAREEGYRRREYLYTLKKVQGATNSLGRMLDIEPCISEHVELPHTQHMIHSPTRILPLATSPAPHPKTHAPPPPPRSATAQPIHYPRRRLSTCAITGSPPAGHSISPRNCTTCSRHAGAPRPSRCPTQGRENDQGHSYRPD